MASDLDNKTVEELRALCQSHELKSTGNKEALIKRLKDYEAIAHMTVAQLSDECKRLGLPHSGKKAELVQRIMKGKKYNQLSQEELAALARRTGQSDKGTKEELARRLVAEPKKKKKKVGKNEEKKDKKDKKDKDKDKKEKKNKKDKTKHDAAAPPAAATPTAVAPSAQPGLRRTVKIASWNIANFSTGSRHKKYHEIARIFQNFDIVAVQEVLNKEVLEDMKKLLPGWDYVSSYECVGRVRKEYYAVMYRADRIKNIAFGQFDDKEKDLLEREPFVATFKCDSFDFTLATIHVLFGKNQSQRRVELGHLKQVLQAILDQNKAERDVMLLGDFNFGPEDEGWEAVKSLGFKPLILPPAKTTVGGQLYDNIWINEKNTTNWTGESVDFSYPGQTLQARNEVSDHRPIWGLFYSDVDSDEDLYGDLQSLKLH